MNNFYVQVPKESNISNLGSAVYYHPNLIVEASLSASTPEIEISIDKLNSRRFSRPVSSKRFQVKAILKADYESYLKRNLNLIKYAAEREAECYAIISTDIIEISMFNLDKKNLYSINIRVSNNLEYGSVEVSKSSSYSRRKKFRTSGQAISQEQFRKIADVIYTYALDEGSYEMNIKSLEAKIRFVLSGEMVLPEIKSANSLAFVQQLEQKKEQLKTRLIENDTDTPLDRATLRGELAGIDYALNAYSYCLLNSQGRKQDLVE